ncbi:DNA adenine methylase, partial [Campylobacter jejuni]|nr:DNA adenine methylase [Campylobacter jejuni]
MQENTKFLKEQIITYLGNKRTLLHFLKQGFDFAKTELNKEKFSFCDVFSGSGIVSRFAKAHCDFLVANDLELYSKIINECYLSNKNSSLIKDLKHYHKKLLSDLELEKGFISKLYAPKDENNIKKNERVFYTLKMQCFGHNQTKIEQEIPQ